MLAKCSSCGRPLNASIAPDGQDPCLICDPKETNQKPIEGVGPVSVQGEDHAASTPEAVEKAKPKKKKVAKKKVAKKKAKKKEAKKK